MLANLEMVDVFAGMKSIKMPNQKTKGHTQLSLDLPVTSISWIPFFFFRSCDTKLIIIATAFCERNCLKMQMVPKWTGTNRSPEKYQNQYYCDNKLQWALTSWDNEELKSGFTVKIYGKGKHVELKAHTRHHRHRTKLEKDVRERMKKLCLLSVIYWALVVCFASYWPF